MEDAAGAVLYHFSEEAGIAVFRPRPLAADARSEPLVWAVDAEHAVNYMLPRDCPRVCFRAGPATSTDDAERLMGPGAPRVVIAVESAWAERIRAAVLHRYHLPAAPFKLADACAGYYTARSDVRPLSVDAVDDCMGALLAADVELRFTPTLWPLHRAVAASTLEFSMIRMRNAAP